MRMRELWPIRELREAIAIGRREWRRLVDTLRERFEPIPLDDEQRIIAWVPAQPFEIVQPVWTRDDDPSPVTREPIPVTPDVVAHYATLARTAAATVVVAQAEEDLEPTPIHDRLVDELAALEAAKVRALRTPTAEFWAIVDAYTGFHCTHCVDGDHTMCPGCECGCTLVAA